MVVRPPAAETLAEVYEFARRHLAGHQLPGRWYLVEQIPRTTRGKVNRADVAEHCATLTPVRIGVTTQAPR